MKTFAVSVAALLAATAVPALAQSYTGGAGTFTGLGSDQNAFPGDQFDIVTLTSLSGNYTGPGSYNLNGVEFDVDINRTDPGVFSGTLSGLTGTFGGNPFTYSVDYTIFINTSDTIRLGGNTIDVFGTPVYLRPITLTGGVGDRNTGVLQAIVGPVGAIPEPATWAMMLMGFGMVGYGLRRRQGKVTTKVSFA